jgi:hypothetical protein
MPHLIHEVREFILVEVLGIHLKGHAVLKDFADVVPLSVIVKDADGVAGRLELFVGVGEQLLPIVSCVHIVSFYVTKVMKIYDLFLFSAQGRFDFHLVNIRLTGTVFLIVITHPGFEQVDATVDVRAVKPGVVCGIPESVLVDNLTVFPSTVIEPGGGHLVFTVEVWNEHFLDSARIRVLVARSGPVVVVPLIVLFEQIFEFLYYSHVDSF